MWGSEIIRGKRETDKVERAQSFNDNQCAIEQAICLSALLCDIKGKREVSRLARLININFNNYTTSRHQHDNDGSEG